MFLQGAPPPPHLSCLIPCVIYCTHTMLFSWCSRGRGSPTLLPIRGPAGSSRAPLGLYMCSLRYFTPPTPLREYMGLSPPPHWGRGIVPSVSSELLRGGGTMFYMSAHSLGLYLAAPGGGLLYLYCGLDTRPLLCMHAFRFLLMLCPVLRRGSVPVSEMGI